jgi:hypothetical protein
MGLEMSMSSRGKREEERRRKEKLLKEQLMEKGERRKDTGMRRQKSMVSLASEDDLLGRRMLGLVGPLTRNTEDDD